MTPVHYSFALLCSPNPGDRQDSPAVVLLLPVVTTLVIWIRTDTRGLQVEKPVQGGFLNTLEPLGKRTYSRED